MSDPALATVPLPDGVQVSAEWWDLVRRQDGTPADRLTLRWTWGSGPTFCMIGLNPSGASEEAADRTLIRVYGYAQREKCGSLLMLNLFSARATDPSDLLRYPGRPGYASEVAHQIGMVGGPVVAGWGSQSGKVGALIRERVAQLRALVTVPLWCLGTCEDGSPRHPLYLRLDAPLTRWTWT